MNKKLIFTGNFAEFFLCSLGLLVLSVITFGIAFPYLIYWVNKYFFSRLRMDGKAVLFTGNFSDYFIYSLGLLALSVFTFGIAFPYWIYWNGKYFAANLEQEA